MRIRAKALTVAVAMVTTFAILPTLGAAAAEPLEDGSYDVLVEDATYTVDVVDGEPVVAGAEGVEFTFAFDEETGRVLDEFGVTVDGVTYEVEVADDGTVSVTVAEDEGEGEEPEGQEPEGDDLADDEEGDDDADIEALEEDDELEGFEEDDEADDEGHGAVVSTVAQCAPAGKQAREAGLPNHGFFVSAAAKGEEVEFDVDGETHTADLSSQEGADAFCELAEELLADAAAELEAAEVEGDTTSEDEGRDRGSGKASGRAHAPGQLKKDG